ncbi:MAG: sn-glycerol-3-phosphate ABC transporter ATP-binding protein UgpC [Pseudomonadota bacterium]
MAEVSLRNVRKTFGGNLTVIEDLSLDIHDGEFLILVGPSGCGKSTALRMIAGLEEVTAGDLLIGGRSVIDMSPKQRDIAMVFQSYALYPHMTVAQNIGFSMRLAGAKKAARAQRVAEVAKILQLDALLHKKPAELSGGQRQRVAMGRAMVREPSVFLMDEPLSNLDAKLRVQMRAEIAELQRQLGVTTVYVTHDQIEAMTMGDRVAVMKDGELLQVDTPKALYDRPVNAFVAGFIGSPSMNLFAAELRGTELLFAGRTMTLPAEVLARAPGLTAFDRGSIVVGIRPEDLHDAALADAASMPTVTGTIHAVEELGAEHVAHLSLDSQAVDSGDPDRVDDLGRANCVARFSPKSAASAGETIEVAVETEKLHFFDPHTHSAIYGNQKRAAA